MSKSIVKQLYLPNTEAHRHCSDAYGLHIHKGLDGRVEIRVVSVRPIVAGVGRYSVSAQDDFAFTIIAHCAGTKAN